MPHDSQPDRTPVPVRIAEAAIAGGACGHPVALYFQDFPAPERVRLWVWFAARIDPRTVSQIFGGGDLATVANRLTDLRLVLVHDPRLHSAVARVIALAGGSAQPRPVVFSAGPAPDPDDDPGGTLVVHGHPETVSALTNWVYANPTGPELAVTPPGEGPALAPCLERLCRPNSSGLTRLRDAMILRGLLAGAWLIRPDRGPEGVRVRPDYERIRHLLSDPALSPADEPLHPLAAAMVGRANAYLRHGSRGTVGAGRPGEVTRSELVDLGDPRGRRVTELLRVLLASPNGIETFRTMGTTRAVGADWPARDAGRLAALLRPWSPKQVRTTFERLTREGMIASQRIAENQPYRYVLPDRLRSRHSPFRLLPTVSEVEREQGPGGAPDCPACPPPAHHPGPAESHEISA
ncbi:MAG: hypothetical protein C0501_23810 [Isosphaera sp.]|nr:hypothetical protein [Isosphaera sp.]